MHKIFTTKNVDDIGIEFANWFRSNFHVNARPRYLFVLGKLYSQCQEGKIVHQFLKHIKYNSIYYVNYSNDPSKVFKIYTYVDGDFIYYKVKNKSGSIVAEGKPKSYTDENTEPYIAPTKSANKKADECVNAFKPLETLTLPAFNTVRSDYYIAKTDFVNGLKKGMIIKYDLSLGCFVSMINRSIIVPTNIAMLPELFDPSDGFDNKNFCDISGYVMLKMLNGYCLGYHFVRKHFGLYKPIAIQDTGKMLIARMMPCTSYDDTGFYNTGNDTVLYVDKDECVYIESEEGFPIIGKDCKDFKPIMKYIFDKEVK